MSKDIEIKAHPGYKTVEEYLTRYIIKLLANQFPGYLWGVDLSALKSTGVVGIFNMELVLACQREFTLTPFGATIKLTTLYDDASARKAIINAGGLILDFAGWPQKYNDLHQVDLKQFARNYFNYQDQLAIGLN